MMSISSAIAGDWLRNQSIGGFQTVDIYVPDTVSPIGNGRSLLIILHGCTQPISSYQTANLETAAENHGMVIAVPDAMNKAGFSCWSYWQGAIDRNSGDYKNLIQLAEALANNSAYQIDGDQRYLSGLSSGATFAAQTACLAPDIFAAVAPSAGPSIGTSSGGAIGNCEVVSPTLFKQRCESYAGMNKPFLQTQIAVVGHGDNDTTVDQCYNQQNANGYASVYAVQPTGITRTISDSPQNTAQEVSWENHKVILLWFNHLAHEWSGGIGANGSYIGNDSINFADYLGFHFIQHNQRVSRNEAPVISNVSVTTQQSQIFIQGTATDSDGFITSVSANLFRWAVDDFVTIETITTTTNNNSFQLQSSSLNDALYFIETVAEDNEGSRSEPIKSIMRVGAEPGATAPVFGTIETNVDQTCVTISGTVYDDNLDTNSITVEFVSKLVSGTIDDFMFTISACGLSGGTQNATLIATDETGLQSTATVEFFIDAGKTGNYQYHINEGHITWGDGYSACYLAFGNNEFTMREESRSNDECEWVADNDSTCNGPLQACRTSTPTPPSPEPPTQTCSQVTSINYSHKTNGRAYSTGNIFAPDYFAQGSNEAMLGSTYGTNTLHSFDQSNWYVGNCP